MSLRGVPILVAATALLLAAKVRADEPTAADCVAATEAAIRSGKQHRLRSKRASLLVCASPGCPGDIRKDCDSGIDEVNKAIPTIVFAAKDPSGADLTAVRVTMDGEVLAERIEGAAISIDPGEHTFTFEAPGHPSITKTLVIHQAQKDRRELIAFKAAGPFAAPGSQSKGSGPLSAQHPDKDTGEAFGTQKVLALAAGGVGILALGVGTAFGLVAMGKKSDAQSTCPNLCATQAGVDSWSSAAAAGTASTVGFVVAGVALAGGTVLWFTAGSDSRTGTTQVGVGLNGITARGTW
jgi:hypothetical protein